MSQYHTLSVKDLMRDAVRNLRASQHDSAVDITSAIIEREPRHAGAHAVQFSALFKAKRFEQARRMGTVAADLNPTSIFVLNNQACLQLEAKQPAAASGLLKSLIEQYGERGQWLYNLALAQRMVGNFDYAINTFSRTLDFDDTHDRAAFQLADCLTLVGQHERAAHAFNYVRLLRNKHAPSHSNYLHHAVVNNSISADDLSLEFALWQDRFVPSDKRYDINPISSSDSLNIAFLIGKLPEHWAHRLVAPVVNTLSANDTVRVYWHDEQIDPALFDGRVEVVPCAHFTDADFARRVRADSIDIMIDVCGMRLGARQRVLGLQVAGKQFGWLAHEGQYATPLVAPLDGQLNQYAADLTDTLSSDNVPNNTLIALVCRRGVSHEVLTIWASILHELPDWKLQGILSTRLSFGPQPVCNNTTIALDNFTENNPALVITALAEGATIVGIRGPLFPAQHTAGILRQCGREDWLCNNNADYQARVIDLVSKSNTQGLSRTEFDASGLANIDGFVKNFRAAITENID